MVLWPKLTASEEKGLRGLADEGSCSDGMIDGAASCPMDMSSLSMASTGSSGCKSENFRLGVEAVFSGESRLSVRRGSGLASKVFRARLSKGIFGLSQV